MPRSIAWYLIVITVFLLFIAVNIQAGWLFVLDFILMAFVFAAWVLPVFWTAGHIRVERFESPIFEGETAEVLLRLTNLSPFSKRFLIVEDLFPAGERSEIVSLFIPSLERNKTVEMNYRKKAGKRGVYPFRFVTLRSLGPAGFFEWKRKLPCEGRLVVYPTALPFPFLMEDAMPAPQPGEKGVNFSKGDGEDFYGIREYGTGDSLRTIHWPSSAKLGKLMIRDMMRSHPTFYTLYLDRDRRWRGEPFERCVKMAVFAAREILRQGDWLRIFHEGTADPKDWWGSLEWLASVEASDIRPLAAQVEAHLPFLLAQRQLVFFTVAPAAFSSDEWQFVNRLVEGFASLRFVFWDCGEPRRADKLAAWLRGRGVSCTFGAKGDEPDADPRVL